MQITKTQNKKTTQIQEIQKYNWLEITYINQLKNINAKLQNKNRYKINKKTCINKYKNKNTKHEIQNTKMYIYKNNKNTKNNKIKSIKTT